MDSTHSATILLIVNDSNVGHYLETCLSPSVYQTVLITGEDDNIITSVHDVGADIILVDDARPDAAVLMNQLQSNPQHTIIAITEQDDESIHKALDAGADDCIIKPINQRLLQQRVQTCLAVRAFVPHTTEVEHIINDSDEKYQRIFDASNDAILVADATTSRIIGVNRRALRMLETTREALIGTLYQEIEVPMPDDDQQKAIVEELSTNGHFLYEQLFRTASGKIVPVEVNSRVFMYEGRMAILNVARDTTRRKRIEQAEREQRQIADALRETASVLSSTLKLDEVIQRIVEQVTRVIPAQGVNVMLIENGFAHVAAKKGYWDDDDWLQNTWDIPKYDTLNKMTQTRQPVLITDVDEFDGWVSTEGQWTRSYVAAPLVSNDAVIGFLNLDHRIPDAFTPTHMEFLQALANQAGIAIQNAQLHEAVQRHAENMEENVTRRTLELVEVNLNLKRQIEERKRIEATLQKERNLLHALINNIPDEIYVKDQNSRIILANKALKRRVQHRVPNGELIGTTDFDYADHSVTPERLEAIYRQEQAIIHEGGPNISEEVQVTGPDGKRWLVTDKVPLHDKDGRVVGIVGVNHDITELRRAEERLTHIIQGAYCLLWYAIVEDNGDDGFTWDQHISSAEAAQRVLPLNVKKGSTYQAAWLNSILPEDWASIKALSRQSIRAGKPGYSYEYRCYRADGKIRWLHEDVQIKPLTKGSYSLVGVVTDITERKEAEEHLQRSNELLESYVKERTAELSKSNEILKLEVAERQRVEQAEREQRILAEALSDVAAALSETLELDEVADRILDHVTKVVPTHERSGVLLIEEENYVRVLRLRDYTGPHDYITTILGERYYLEDYPGIQPIMERNGPVIIDDVQQDPTWKNLEDTRWIRAFIGVPIQSEGRIIGFIFMGCKTSEQFDESHAQRLLAFSNQAGIAIQNARLFNTVRNNATDLRRRVAERTRELEFERAQLRAILDAMTEGVIYQDAAGQISYINQSLTHLTGYTVNEWSEQRHLWSELVVKDKTKTQELAAITSDRIKQRGVWKGEIKMYRKNGESFDAAVVTSLVIGSDGQPAGSVTVLRDISAEKRLEAQKARFIATASHELRTPITNLKTRLYLAEHQPEKLAEHMDVMGQVTNRMRKLVEDLLDVSRFEHGIIPLKRQEITVQALIKDVLKVQQPEAERKEISLMHDMPSSPVYISADEQRVIQVITNLVTNAINYTPEQGMVTVSVEVDDHHPDEHWVDIAVRDTGIGIPEELVPEVFTPFFRVSDASKGMGLGLAITKEIVEMHKGKISVESEENVGTCFRVKLPLTAQSKPPFVEV